MVIGLLKIEFFLSGCSSLKEKRQRLAGLKDRFGKLKNVATCESDLNDSHQRGEISFLCMGNSKSIVEPILATISQFCATKVDAQIVNEYTEWL